MKSTSWMKVAIALLGSAPALAAAERVVDPSPAVTYQFEEELVPGDLLRPEGETLVARGRGARQSLVEVRTSYLTELLTSVEDL